MGDLNKKIVLIGGGTTNPIANHLSLSATAYGTTVDTLENMICASSHLSSYEIEVIKTKMADSDSNIITNGDLSKKVDELIQDKSVKSIIFSAAVCDFEYEGGDFHGERISSNKAIKLKLKPSEKIIGKIRSSRPDIFLVGFKTTTNKSFQEQFLIGLEKMKKSKCNLMFCNDVTTRNNMIITAEETIYGASKVRLNTLTTLVELLEYRINGTYNSVELIPTKNILEDDNFTNLKEFFGVLKDLSEVGVFITNNGNSFTPGHFCLKVSIEETRAHLALNGIELENYVNPDEILDFAIISSQRKANHNRIETCGLTLVIPLKNGDSIAFGDKKPSVGTRTQIKLLLENPDDVVIIHTHNPIREGYRDMFEIRDQFKNQCGSLECGLNTLNGLKSGVLTTPMNTHKYKAVYLEKHGFNLLLSKEVFGGSGVESMSYLVTTFFQKYTYSDKKVM